MHNAKIETSVRLKRMLSELEKGGIHSTLELQKATNDMAPATTISELRRNGLNITCAYSGTNSEGRKIYNYQLLPF